MKTPSSLLTMPLMVFIWTISPLEVFPQNSRVDWSAFSSGFEVPGLSNTMVKSSVGQTFVGSSQLVNSRIESGFLANPLLRGTIVGVNEQPDLPTVYSLSQNYPNPFNPSTTFAFYIQHFTFVILKVYDLIGREVATLVNEARSPGSYEVTWDATGLASGVYFYRLQAGEFVQTKRLMLLR